MAWALVYLVSRSGTCSCLSALCVSKAAPIDVCDFSRGPRVSGPRPDRFKGPAQWTAPGRAIWVLVPACERARSEQKRDPGNGLPGSVLTLAVVPACERARRGPRRGPFPNGLGKGCADVEFAHSPHPTPTSSSPTPSSPWPSPPGSACEPPSHKPSAWPCCACACRPSSLWRASACCSGPLGSR